MVKWLSERVLHAPTALRHSKSSDPLVGIDPPADDFISVRQANRCPPKCSFIKWFESEHRNDPFSSPIVVMKWNQRFGHIIPKHWEQGRDARKPFL
ncbi:hypothetical protein AVEN_259938-1 [Araneus ventricosus]|uniref:Uncharacterized protein n=1 Tax=Araneus ventricosus TaxID=182803 RepID=A0A4Y2GPN6_ARAVE|nr:hypothetical protein AVEN_259938-1 [Araneus ventricosus]